MQSSQLADIMNIALISCCVLSPDYVERISGATAVRHILRLTGLFLVALVMISGAAPYWLAAGGSTYLSTVVMDIIIVQPYMAGPKGGLFSV